MQRLSQVSQDLTKVKQDLTKVKQDSNRSEIPTSSDDCISRQDVLSEIIRFSTEEGSSVECQQLYCDVNNMPPVTPQEPKWIPVSERLPEDRELVLCSSKRGGVFEGRYFDDETDCQWYAFRNDEFVRNDVIDAWMPLPKPYREVEE